MKIFLTMLLILFTLTDGTFAGSGTECRDHATIFNDGTGDNRTKKRGGNYTAIPLESLKKGDSIKIEKLSGNLRYVTLHARFQGGYWRTIHKGPETEFPFDKYLARYKKDPKCTHVNISVNGAHEKYEPIACKARIKVCSPSEDTGCNTLAEIYNDGRGNNRTKKMGGNYAAIEMAKLKSGQTLQVTPTSGNLKYVTLHARFQGGIWRTIHKGPETKYPFDRYLAKYKKDPKCTHVIISVNGGHERYEPIPCMAKIQVCSPSKEPGCSALAEIYNDGRGNNRTKKLGGNYAAIEMAKLKSGQTLQVTATSGRLKYVTLHARYHGGIWRTIHKGPETKYPFDKYLAKYKKDPKCTHVIVSVNGAHERYEPIACKANIMVCH